MLLLESERGNIFMLITLLSVLLHILLYVLLSVLVYTVLFLDLSKAQKKVLLGVIVFLAFALFVVGI